MFWPRHIVNCNSYNRNTYYCWIINKMDYRFDKKKKATKNSGLIFYFYFNWIIFEFKIFINFI